MDDALHILRSIFGYDQFRLHQAEVIATLLNGGDALVLMPTGGGKSLCYQIPAIARPGTAVVISPLIALMQDQVVTLNQAGVPAAFLNSTQSPDQQREVERQFLRGDLDLLYVAPERLVQARTLDLFERARVALFAIDEAHCVSQWGHDFRPEYMALTVLRERFPGVPRIAVTATADARTRREIVARLKLEDARVFISSFDRPNIRYQINQGSNARDRLLRFLREEHAGDAGIVYCLSRKRVEETAAWLVAQGLTALPYHAGLTNDVRRANQERFLNDEGVIMVATIAFGMGIDKPNVRFVAHLNLPKSIEAYYQETGRAGRDGLPADAWMSYGLQDVITLRQMLEQSQAEETYKRVERHKLDAMLAFCELTTCRRQALLGYFGETLDKACGNCDTCLEPPETWDATLAAQKALSCVHRTGQRFGVNYLIDVLRGKDDERIKRFGHDATTTFGIGTDMSENEWRGLYRQLIARGLLSVDLDGHGGLHLTDASRAVLRGEERLWLRRDAVKPATIKAAKTAKQKGAVRAPFATDADRQLWDALRARRLELAKQKGVPPYVIFHDATLAEMVAQRPQTLDAFAQISGVGERKLAAYGAAFLAIIQAQASDVYEVEAADETA